MKKAKRFGTPEYTAWHAMKGRCSNKNLPNWKDYGGRGITICERWISNFENFLGDMGPRPIGGRWSIERINNDGNYEPANCRWGTYKEQANNRRNTLIFEKNGESRTILEWSKFLSLDLQAARRMIKTGNGFTRITPTVKSKRKGGVVGRPPKPTPCPWCNVPHPVGKLRAHMTQCGIGR